MEKLDKSFLDKVASLKIKENTNIDEEKKKSGREIEDDIITYQINDNDNTLVVATKLMINESKILKSYVYSIMGREKGYNMIYQLQNNVLSWKRLEDWCLILNIKPIIKFEKN